MKTQLTSRPRTTAGYALLVVLVFAAGSLLILSATMNRTSTVAKLNDRNNQYIAAVTAAEAAVEKAYGWMAYDFQVSGYGVVTSSLASYRGGVPLSTENTNWAGFIFGNATSALNAGSQATYVECIGSRSGVLPSAYPTNVICLNSPIYRIISNARSVNGSVVAAVQVDVLLALVPLNTYAIFYNGNLEFSDCATMSVNGRVHSNSNLLAGAGSSATLTFQQPVTASSTITANARNSKSWTTPTSYDASNWRTYLTNSGSLVSNSPSVSISIPMTNTHALIDMPPSGELLTTNIAKQRLFNQAQTLLLISNNAVWFKMQTPPAAGQLAAADSSSVTMTFPNHVGITTNLPFLTLTNIFYDAREGKTNLASQIDVGLYREWIRTNATVIGKFPTGGASTNYPTILYVADNRSTNKLPVVRLTNGLALPNNGGQGWTVATPNPLYVWGNYNCTNTSFLATSNTAATVPSALISDSMTILSTQWKDTNSLKSTYSSGNTNYNAAPTNTINAAILTGVVPSTGTSSTTFSGGVHNLPRMLEDWSSSTMWLNTSIVNLYSSTKATNQWQYQGTYYNPPIRRFAFDQNFLDPAKQPPGMPCALVPVRIGWANPPPNTINYTNSL